MRLPGSGPQGSSIPLLVVLFATFASSSASANGIPGPFDVMHLVVYLNFPFNGLLLLFLFEVAYLTREDVPFTPVTFLTTFILSVAVLTFTGAILDGLLLYSSLISFVLMGPVVGAVAGLLSYRYLDFTKRQAVATAVVFTVYNIVFWTVGEAIGPWLGALLDNRWFLHLLYLIFFVLTVSYAFARLRQTRVVTIHPYTGDRRLERVEHGPAWERTRAVLEDRMISELLVFALLTMIISVVFPLLNEPML
jgi:MFS family permease